MDNIPTGLATRKACLIEYLKTSALGAYKDFITMTGKRLSRFAECLMLPFKFNPLMIIDITKLTETMFEMEEMRQLGSILICT